jgi:hypothetical protein
MLRLIDWQAELALLAKANDADIDASDVQTERSLAACTARVASPDVDMQELHVLIERELGRLGLGE